MCVDLRSVDCLFLVSSVSDVEGAGASSCGDGVCGLTDCSLTTCGMINSSFSPSSGADDLKYTLRSTPTLPAPGQ